MPPALQKITVSNRLLGSAAASCLILFITFVGIQLFPHDSPPRPIPAGGENPFKGTPVCDQPILRSPFDYDGAAGKYSSGTPGLPTYGKPNSDFPHATAGVALPPGNGNYLSYQLKPDTVYYLLPGTHSGGIQANKGDAFVGGLAQGKKTILNGNYSSGGQAIDSNVSDGNQPDVTIEYLTVEKYQPNGDAAAINEEANTGWNIRFNTITLNVPGAGVMAGSRNTLTKNCLTLNGQYGFQSTDINGFGGDSLTHGPYGINIVGNEISYNDTCDFSGLLNNPAIGWKNHNPVPAKYRNPECGKISGNGNQGGFKLWQTNGVTIKDNYIHHNWGPGGWADTNNANTTWTGNTFVANEGAAIIEEISYNFSITNNRIADNDWADGLNNSTFPQPAIFISESGSDTKFAGVPACREAACKDQSAYPGESIISNNVLVDNGGSIFLWQNSNRYCSDKFDSPCTLVGGGASGPFTVSACKANLPSASVNTSTYKGRRTGTPLTDWWNGCTWRTENVSVTKNTVDFNPADIKYCNQSAWPACGAGGVFSEYGSPPNSEPGWVVPTQITFFQHNSWSDNTYNGPSTFYAWNQGNGNNPVSWGDWTGSVTLGDKCGSAAERHSGYCNGPFGQDSGSTYNSFPVSSPAGTGSATSSG